jgi:hypothetical protein
MKTIMMVIALGVSAGFGAVTAAGPVLGVAMDAGPPVPAHTGAPDPSPATAPPQTSPAAPPGRSVSEEQYRVLVGQCSYVKTAPGRDACRSAVRATYHVGEASDSLDCRTYSGVTVCGELHLTDSQTQCVRHSVLSGLPFRRSEVECYVAY